MSKILYNIDHLRLSNSTDNVYDSCHRKFEFRKLFFYPDKRESFTGSVGNCLHRGYQDYVVNRDRDKAIFTMMLNYPIDLNSDPSDPRSLEACYNTMNVMMSSQSFLEYEIAEIKCLDGVIRKAVEVPFVIHLKNLSLSDDEYIPITYVGYIDLILYDRMTGEYIVVDIKTTRYWLKDMTPLYRFDDQCIPYALVLERALGNPINNLNIKYFAVYVDIDKAKAMVYSFERGKDEIEDWARNEYIRIQDMKRFFKMGWWPRNSNACVSFNRICPYFDICNKRDIEGIQRLLLMEQEPYKEEPIEPWVTMELELTA